MTIQFWLAILALILIPLMPRLLRIRIAFYRLVHWRWAVKVHEKHFKGIVLGARIFLLLVAAVLLNFGLSISAAR